LSKRLIVELDGGYHEQTVENDIERETALRSLGWKVIRFSNEEVLENVEAVLHAIAAAADTEYEFHKRNDAPSGLFSQNKPKHRKSK
jgi:very-short-patch-repair endonuclease